MNTLGEMVNPGAQRASYVQGLDVQFQRIVSLYTRRQLKNPGDILHAVTGVYNRFFASSDMHGIGIDVLQGIPMRCFSRALLWFPKPSRTKRSDSCGTNPSTWSWIYWITAVDFACEMNSSFPSSAGRVFHNATNAFSLVEEWCLTFQKGDTVATARFSTRELYGKVEKNIRSEEIDVEQFLNTIPRGDQGDASAGSAPPIPGLLDFRALYIPVPIAASSPRWSRKLGREWHLSFRGRRVYDTTLECTAIALLDCDETTLDGFVLLLYDCNLMGICVKKAEDYFERVGVCIFTTSRKDWERIMKKGLLEIYWKRIFLR
jgi:hypothetical protein